MTPEQLLSWKLRLFWAGAALVALGIALNRRPLILAAIVVLSIGVLLRFLHRPPPPPKHPDWDQPDP